MSRRSPLGEHHSTAPSRRAPSRPRRSQERRALRVEARQRLVEQHHLGTRQERHRDAQPLALSHRHAIDATVGELAQVEGVDRALDALADAPARNHRDPRPELELAAHGQPGVQAPVAGGQERDERLVANAVLPGAVTPHTSALPRSGSIRPAAMRSIVVLPAPLRPPTHVSVPGSSARSTPSSTAGQVLAPALADAFDRQREGVLLIQRRLRRSRCELLARLTPRKASAPQPIAVSPWPPTASAGADAPASAPTIRSASSAGESPASQVRRIKLAVPTRSAYSSKRLRSRPASSGRPRM